MEVYQLVVFGLLAWMTLGTMLNVWVFPTVRPARPGEPKRQGSDVPRVSVLVPARNEERNIGTLVDSLQRQDDPNFEVLVLDDRSDDQTVAILEAKGFVDGAHDSSARFRYYRGQELPTGWTGKPWACTQLAAFARGQWLLFTDADTLHAPSAVRAAMESAQRLKAGLLSAWPRQIMGTWAERWVIPLVYVLTHTLLPQALVSLINARPTLARRIGPKGLAALGAANGQFMLFRRDVYERLGGHAAVRSHLVEDVALGRLVMASAATGDLLVNADGTHQVSCRMYHGVREVWEGFSKNLRPAFGTNLLAFVGSGVFQLALFVLPALFFVVGCLQPPGQILPGFPWIAGQVALLGLIRLVLAWRFRTGWWVILCHPLAYLLALTIALNSWRWAMGGRIRWKGREYRA